MSKNTPRLRLIEAQYQSLMHSPLILTSFHLCAYLTQHDNVNEKRYTSASTIRTSTHQKLFILVSADSMTRYQFYTKQHTFIYVKTYDIDTRGKGFERNEINPRARN